MGGEGGRERRWQRCARVREGDRRENENLRILVARLDTRVELKESLSLSLSLS